MFSDPQTKVVEVEVGRTRPYGMFAILRTFGGERE